MKKKFEAPDIELIRLEMLDILTKSDQTYSGDDGDDENETGWPG